MDNPYADFDGSGNLKVRYLYGLVVDQVLARTDSGGTSAWYLPDRLGTIRDVANTSGSIIDHVVYSSFGGVNSESSPTNGDRFKFTGREYGSEVGQYYFRARYYDPGGGRFAALDPMGFRAGDANTYRYVSNMPSDRADASGMDPPGGLAGPPPKINPPSVTLSAPVDAIRLSYWTLCDWWDGIDSVGRAYTDGDIGSEAVRWSKAADPTSPPGTDYQKAARHAYWQMLMMNEIGEALAISIGNAHEWFTTNWADSRIDQYNNELARKLYYTELKKGDQTMDGYKFVSKEVLHLRMQELIRQHIKNGDFIVQAPDPRLTGKTPLVDSRTSNSN
jgi:RHS repeat-associated protein